MHIFLYPSYLSVFDQVNPTSPENSLFFCGPLANPSCSGISKGAALSCCLSPTKTAGWCPNKSVTILSFIIKINNKPNQFIFAVTSKFKPYSEKTVLFYYSLPLRFERLSCVYISTNVSIMMNWPLGINYRQVYAHYFVHQRTNPVSKYMKWFSLDIYHTDGRVERAHGAVVHHV